MAETIRVHPDCPNASNPYHECGQYCTPKITEAAGRKGKKNSSPILLSAPRSFDRRVKESKTQPKPRQVPHSISAPMNGSLANDDPSPQLSSKEKAESRKAEPLSVFPYSSEICVEDAITPDSPGKLPNDNLKSNGNDRSEDIPRADKPEQNGKHHIPSETGFKLSAISQDLEDTDEEDMISMISDYDSRVWVGKYHVKAGVASTLQAIFDKHGDIVASCHLESLALRAYYLECVCFVVQELQTTPVIKLTKAKLREMLAILKDMESAQISVAWLRRVLSEIVEIIEPIVLQQAIEAAKASAKKELEGQMEDLAVKEKEVADVRARIAETEARLTQIELESYEFNKNLSTVRSKVENFDFKTLLGELL